MWVCTSKWSFTVSINLYQISLSKIEYGTWSQVTISDGGVLPTTKNPKDDAAEEARSGKGSKPKSKVAGASAKTAEAPAAVDDGADDLEGNNDDIEKGEDSEGAEDSEGGQAAT
jgi:hypothetical protein